jgi:acyl-CoA reductase-like NAD-dependent aldehyde dehydrogenase
MKDQAMPEKFPLLLANATPAAGVAQVTAPFDGAVIAEIETGDENHVDQALATAFALYRNRDAWLPLPKRIAILERAASLVAEQQEHLALEAAREGGKPLIDSRVEVARAIDGLRLP